LLVALTNIGDEPFNSGVVTFVGSNWESKEVSLAPGEVRVLDLGMFECVLPVRGTANVSGREDAITGLSGEMSALPDDLGKICPGGKVVRLDTSGAAAQRRAQNGVRLR